MYRRHPLLRQRTVQAASARAEELLPYLVSLCITWSSSATGIVICNILASLWLVSYVIDAMCCLSNARFLAAGEGVQSRQEWRLLGDASCAGHKARHQRR